MGVPVSAHILLALMSLKARTSLACVFLSLWASSAMTSSTCSAASGEGRGH